MPQVQKAKSLYSIWKEEDKTQCAQQSTAPSKPVQQQAAEMYAKGAEVYSSSVKPALSSAAVQAQTLYKEQLAPLAASTMAKVSTVFNETVQPRLSSTLAAAQEQAAVIRQDGLGVTMDNAGKAYQRRMAGAKKSVIDTYEDKVPLEQRQKIREVKSGIVANLRLGWNKALDVWEAQEPTLRAWANRAIVTVKRNKLELPLLFLGTLIALWAAMSLVGWAAFPNKAQTSALPVLYQPHLHPSTGPVQGANLPTLTDKLKMKLDSADEQLRDTYDNLRDSGAQQLHDLKGSVHDLKARVSSSIPSTTEVKSRAADAMPDVDVNRIRGRVVHGTNDVKDRVIDSAADIKERVTDTTYDIKERVESGASDIKGRVQSGASDIKGRVESGARELKGRVVDGAERVMDGASDLKDRVVDAMPSMRDIKHEAAHIKGRVADGIDSARAAMPTMPAAQPDAAILTHIHTAKAAPLPAGVAEGDIALKMKDRLHHATHAVPDGLRDLRAKVIGLKDSIVNKLSPASHPTATPMHNDLLDPDQHVVEEMDRHKHVKESIQI
jgi:gas vesicle protein